MEKNKRIISLLGAVVAVIVIVVLVVILMKPGREGREVQVFVDKEIAGKAGVPPVNISLELIPGAAEDKSLVILRLFSKKLQQQKLNGEEVSPIQLTADKNIWIDDILYVLNEENAEPAEIDKDRITLLRAPKEREITFTPETVIQIFYEIKPTSCLIPGAELSASLKLDKYTLKSNKIFVPPLPTNDFDRALRSARIHSLTDPALLLEEAKTLIKEKPESYLGYWYQAIALEYNKDYKGALTAYETALKYYPPSTQNEHYEYPVYIIRKITQLKKLLAGPER